MPKTAEKTTTKEETTKRKDRYFYANGKRKTSVARVRLYEKGKGDITINDKPVNEYFFGALVGKVKAPLKLVDMLKRFDVIAKVVGGGVSSQSEAVRHGVAKALIEFDPALRTALKRAGYLTRDSRVKERKKFGLHGARRAPQWAKR